MEQIKEPFIHITKKTNVSKIKALKMRLVAILLGLFVGCILMLVTLNANPITVIQTIFSGAFGTERRVWNLLKETALLLLVSLALVPAFKMKFWNLGGNGQILMGALGATICMFYMGKANIDRWLIVLAMIPTSISFGIIWALIPAVFKALFNTNESLFTLMLNYVAVGIVALFIKYAVPNGSGAIGIIQTGWLPQIGSSKFLGQNILLSVIVAAVIFILVACYLKLTKHGYELEVVGESTNTARYIGINVKKVIIRTMILSGAICGIVGLLLAGSIDHSVSETTGDNMGFTAIMVAWLAQLNPAAMCGTSFMICFLNRGMSQVRSKFKMTNNSISSVILGIVYFFIIGCEFFINYKINFKDCKFTRAMSKVFTPIGKFFDMINNFFASLYNKVVNKLSRKENI